MKVRRSNADTGFSLIEIVIVLFLTGIMLGCVAKLTDSTFKTMKFLQEKSTTLESATLACQRLATEMREMVQAPNLGADSISFSKVIPSSPLYIGNDPADSSGWQRVYPAGQRATIVYDQEDDKVTRRVNSEPSMEVAVNVNTFAVTEVNGRGGDYQVSLTILESRRAITFQTFVVCAGVPRT